MSGRFALVLCLLISLFYFGDSFFGSRCLVPSGFLYQSEPLRSEFPQYREEKREQFDLLYQFYPWADFFRRTVYNGHFPLWNPYNYLGTPFFANPQTALLFPLTWVHLFFPLRYSFTILFILKLMALLSGMYLFLRSFELTSEASLAGAMVCALSTHSLISLSYPYSSVTLLFPWTLLAVRRLVERNSVRNTVLFAIALALNIVAGQPQSALVSFLFVVVFLLVRARFSSGFQLRTAALTLLCFTAAAMLAAVQWIPSFEYFWDSLVAEGPRIVGSGIPYAPRNLVNFLIPDFFGNHRNQNYWGFPGYNDTAFYSSVIAVLLAPWAFLRRNTAPTKRALRSFAVIAGGMACLWMLGMPGLESLLDLPGLSLVARNKFAFLLIFSLGTLAALGWEAFFSSMLRGRHLLYVTAALLVFCGTAVLWHFWHYVAALHLQRQTLLNVAQPAASLAIGLLILGSKMRSQRLLLALLLIDLAFASFSVNARGRAEALYPPSPTLQKLEGKRASSLEGMLPPNASMIYQIQDCRGYDVMTPRRLFLFLKAIDPEFADVYGWFRKLDRTGVHADSLMTRDMDRAIEQYGEPLALYMKTSGNYYVPSVSRIRQADLFNLLNLEAILSHSFPGTEKFVQAGPYVYLNRGARRASFYGAWVHATAETALEQLKQIDAGHTAVVEFNLPAPSMASSTAAASIQENHWEASRQIYQIKSDSPGVFVQNERFYGGWRAYVDGKVQPVFPANYLFRGVFLPAAGSHVVDLRYEPRSFAVGAVISGMTLLLCMVAVVTEGLVARNYSQAERTGR